MYKVLDNFSPTEDEVRKWGFDEDLLFTDQDEDLVLYANQYLPVLWQLACDPKCPKKEYCLSILTNYCKSLFLTRDIGSIRELARVIEGTRGVSFPHRPNWYSDFNQCKMLMENPQSIDLDGADHIAKYLLSSDDYSDIKRIGKTHSGLIEYMKSGMYAVYLYIDLSNAQWMLSRFQRLPDSTQ